MIGKIYLTSEEDSKADVDMNFVMTGSGRLVEVQNRRAHPLEDRPQANDRNRRRAIRQMTTLQKKSLGRSKGWEKDSHCHANSGNPGDSGDPPPWVENLSLQDFPEIPEIIEDGQTFEENAVKKAAAVARQTGRMAIADDSGLAVMPCKGGLSFPPVMRRKGERCGTVPEAAQGNGWNPQGKGCLHLRDGCRFTERKRK
jgi:hypothetical protein